MKFSNKTYDILKYIALIALPTIQIFWMTIGNGTTDKKKNSIK